MKRILIVEDDRGIAEAVKKYGEKWGLEVVIATDFHDVLADYNLYQPHLVLLDISLPYFNGYYWCNEIRKISQVPIVFISSFRENMNILMAMNMGADDFIVKPFDGDVLIAKINALLRRTYDFSNEQDFLHYKDLTLNVCDNSLTYKEEKIDLSRNEYRIIYCLLKNRGKIVKREKLMEELWNTDSFIDENTLTVNINRLRKKLKELGIEDFIVTKHARGYIVE
ncbi:MAG: response regulator transcription factor [Erysipelotrichia bacterium]|nr:response regulator transcription factor [Erysipelotrichia bacterium]